MPSEFAITQIVIARGRSSGANSTVSSDIDSGIRNAAPTPSSARAAISSSGDDGERARRRRGAEHQQRAEQHRFCPNRSPSSPAGSSSAASTSVYAFANHCS